MSVHTERVITWAALSRVVDRRKGASKAQRPEGSGTASQRSGNTDAWQGGTYDNAVKMLRWGWPEGVRAVQELTRGGVAVDGAPAWELDVAGYLPCVQAYVAGDPACMLTQGERGTRQRIALIASACYNSGVTADDAMVYAAALAQVVAELDAAGVDVGVDTLDVTYGNGNVYVMGVHVREFGEPLDLSKLVYAFHPSFLRRILFAWREMDAISCKAGIADDNYGSARNATRDYAIACIGPDANGAVILPSLADVLEHCREKNVAGVVAAIREAIKEQSSEAPAAA
jgi:hypothetical protein